MSTLQRTTGLRDRIGSRLGTILLALSVLCAIGVAVLILVSSGHPAHKPIPRIGAAHAHATLVAPAAPTAVPTPAPRGYFRDPVTHALLRVRIAAPTAVSTAVPTQAPPGYFRDPVTHALLRIHTTPSGGAPPSAIHSEGRIVR